jgi:hypothetical protein
VGGAVGAGVGEVVGDYPNEIELGAYEKEFFEKRRK